MSIDLALCRRIVGEHPYPLAFTTVSGAHLYGFPSGDSDYDLRGVHLLPLRELVSLSPPRETVESSGVVEGVEIDLVTHDLGKFIRLMLKRNGYVLEQLLSPLVVGTTTVHDELIALADGCLTRHHAHHYLGFAETQRALLLKENPRRLKPLLYLYRVLLTGVHLMRSGVIEANLTRLNDEYPQDGLVELIARKVGGAERETLDPDDADAHVRVCDALRDRLIVERDASSLPDEPTARAALAELLVRVRLGGV